MPRCSRIAQRQSSCHLRLQARSTLTIRKRLHILNAARGKRGRKRLLQRLLVRHCHEYDVRMQASSSSQQPGFEQMLICGMELPISFPPTFCRAFCMQLIDCRKPNSTTYMEASVQKELLFCQKHHLRMYSDEWGRWLSMLSFKTSISIAEDAVHCLQSSKCLCSLKTTSPLANCQRWLPMRCLISRVHVVTMYLVRIERHVMTNLSSEMLVRQLTAYRLEIIRVSP